MSDLIRTDADGTTSRIRYYLSVDQWWYNLDTSLRQEELRIGRDLVLADGTIDPDGGCLWEFTIVRKVLVGNAYLRADVFDDAWGAFAEIPEFFAHLAANQIDHDTRGTVTLADLADWCAEQGWLDGAERVSPYDGARR